jgi:hypothetical protein
MVLKRLVYIQQERKKNDDQRDSAYSTGKKKRYICIHIYIYTGHKLAS